jgi:hypothetical protein
MRLSDAGLRWRQTKLIYPDHRLPLWLNEDATPRSLEPIVRSVRALTRAYPALSSSLSTLRNVASSTGAAPTAWRSV